MRAIPLRPFALNSHSPRGSVSSGASLISRTLATPNWRAIRSHVEPSSRLGCRDHSILVSVTRCEGASDDEGQDDGGGTAGPDNSDGKRAYGRYRAGGGRDDS